MSKSGHIVWEGHFALSAPASWTFQQQPELLELNSPGDRATAHFSVFPRNREELPTQDDARSLLGFFLERQGITGLAFNPHQEENCARVSTEFLTNDSPVSLCWYVEVRVSLKTALVASLCYGPGNEALKGEFLAAMGSLEFF